MSLIIWLCAHFVQSCPFLPNIMWFHSHFLYNFSHFCHLANPITGEKILCVDLCSSWQTFFQLIKLWWKCHVQWNKCTSPISNWTMHCNKCWQDIFLCNLCPFLLASLRSFFGECNCKLAQMPTFVNLSHIISSVLALKSPTWDDEASGYF